MHTLDRDAGLLEGAVAGSWSLGIVEQSQGQGLLLTVERRIQGMWGRRLWWEMPVEESPAPWKQGDTAESRVGRGAITVASLPHMPASAAEQ